MARREEMHRGRMGSERERRGEAGEHTGRDPRTERRERERRGGGAYDAGPGMEGMPSGEMLDRRPSPQGAFERTGGRREGWDGAQRRIQDAEGHWREHR